MDSDNVIYIGKNCQMESMAINIRRKGTLCFIDDELVCMEARLNLHDSSNIYIGKRCLFSKDIHMYSTDFHTIFEVGTRRILNMPRPIVIADDVWIGFRTIVLKGAFVPDNCVVGAGSVIAREYDEENCVICGSPGRVVRRNVNWSISSPFAFE